MIQIIKAVAILHASVLILATTKQVLVNILDDNFAGVLWISCISLTVCLLLLYLRGQIEKQLQTEIQELNKKLDYAEAERIRWRDYYDDLKTENNKVLDNLHSHIRHWENEYNKLKQQTETENENKTD